MTKLVLMWAVIGHVLGDYYFQPAKLAETKKGNFKNTLRHCGIYGGVFISLGLLLFLVGVTFSATLILLVIVAHTIVDLVKVSLEKQKLLDRNSIGLTFLVDQCLHIIFLLLIVGIGTSATSNQPVSEELLFITKICLFILLLFKPSNVAFKLLFSKYQYTPKKDSKEDTRYIKKPLLPETVDGAGAVIGNLERLIMACFLLLNQYAAIGLVLTAKSITRYNKISTDPAFSEYYLIGTLFSVLATIIPYILLFELL